MIVADYFREDLDDSDGTSLKDLLSVKRFNYQDLIKCRLRMFFLHAVFRKKIADGVLNIESYDSRLSGETKDKTQGER